MMTPEIRREVAAALLINPLPPTARMRLLLDEVFRTKLGLEPEFSFPLRNGVSVEARSLHRALRAAIAGKKTASITLKGGKRRRVRLGRLKGGKATFVLNKEGFAFSNADLLSARRQTRLNGLKGVFAAQPLSPREEAAWHEIAEKRVLTDREYDDLMSTLGETPEAFSSELRKRQGLNAETLLPASPDYFHRLVGELGDSTDMHSFIRAELTAARQSLMARSRSCAIRRIALSALWQPLIPFDLMGSLAPKDVSTLLAVEDPFSLLFGFELCRALLEKDSSFADLGTRFLEKLFGDQDAGERRCEVFAACAVIATVRVRRAAKAASAPVFWARLIALAHAGLLADALARIPDSKDFLRWALAHFGPSYVWHSIVDRREAPRWKPDWVGPKQIFAELVGRALGALSMLPEHKRPAEWSALIDTVMERLSADGQMLGTMFPGPFDDFHEEQSRPNLDEVVTQVEARLDVATNLVDTLGFAALAFTTIPSERAKANVSRILNALVDEGSGRAENELPDLQLAAHFAAVARSDAIADAIKNRCFALARTSSPGATVDLFAVACEACAAHLDVREYRKALGDVALRFSFLIGRTEDAENLSNILETLTQRDEKLSPSLARARAVLRTRAFKI